MKDLKTFATTALLTLAFGACVASAQTTIESSPTTTPQGFQVRIVGKQRWPIAEAEKLYVSSCAAVQHEFRVSHALNPQVTLVLGADKDVLEFKQHEIRLTKWDRFFFAQGVVVLAFEELLPQKELLSVTQRAVTWADSTVDIKQIAK